MSLRENPGAAISGGAHILLLAAALLSFSRTARFDDAQETIPVDLMSDAQFNQIMKGEKTAAKREKPLQKVEKLAAIAEAKPPSLAPPSSADAPAPLARASHRDDPGRDEAKLPPAPAERPAQEPMNPPVKPEPPKAEAVKSAAAVPPPAPAAVESPDAIDPKPAQRPKAEAKKAAPIAPKPKLAEPPKKPEPKFKPDELAKLLEQQKPEEKPKDQPQKPKYGEATAEPAVKFDLSDISRILNKENPQRKAATGQELQQLASLGAPTASAAKMSPSLWGQLDGLLQDQYRHCWNYIGMAGQEKYVPQIHVQYAQDGALIGQPELLNPPSDPNLRSLADSAIRAVRRCNPLRIPAQYQPYYDQWKGRIVRFDPEDML
jgi:colicin import membrane protein